MKLKQKFGFTLIELLLAMGIIAFMATASVAIMGNFRRNQNIKIAHDDLKNALAQAKSYALSQVKSENCDTNNSDINLRDELKGYEVKFDTINQTYAVYEVCRLATTGVDTPLEPPVKVYKLPTGITFVNSSIPTIRFLVLTGGSLNNQSITITNGNTSLNKTISVTTGGVIK